MTSREGQQGQALVLFALALTAIVAAVGLVLDGGAVYAQRRSQQNATDLGALAGANTYLLTGSRRTSTTAVRTSTVSNGYTHNSAGFTVSVSYDFSAGVRVTVAISGPHRNSFASVVGQSTWNVSTTATAQGGYPDTAHGAAAFIFSIDAFDANGDPLSQYSDPAHPYPFGDGNGDVPNNGNDIAWTNYGTGNVDSSEVSSIISGSLVIEKQLAFGEYIGQHNNGNHSTLFSDVDSYLSGTDQIVPIVDHNGNFQGWATFHVVSASGGSSKALTGYFKTDYEGANVDVGCLNGTCPRFLGTYVLKLVR